MADCPKKTVKQCPEDSAFSWMIVLVWYLGESVLTAWDASGHSQSQGQRIKLRKPHMNWWKQQLHCAPVCPYRGPLILSHFQPPNNSPPPTPARFSCGNECIRKHYFVRFFSRGEKRGAIQGLVIENTHWVREAELPGDGRESPNEQRFELRKRQTRLCVTSD